MNLKDIPVHNIFHMLSYAFQCLKEGVFKDLADEQEDFENVDNLYAEILIRGVSCQIKRGLLREYVEETDSLKCPHGKIDVSQSIKSLSLLNRALVCTYDEHTDNSLLNQIIKATLTLLLHSPDVDLARKKRIRRVMMFMTNIKPANLRRVNWNQRFSRNSQTYKMLIYICHWVYKDKLLNDESNEKRNNSFDDDQEMHRLYEKFLLEFFRYHYAEEFSANASHLDWQLDDDFCDMLPAMKTDVTLENESQVLIIDAKCYEKTLQSYYDSHTIHSKNIYQIFTYVKNRSVEELLSGDKKIVSGMLLYAKTTEEITPDQNYKMSGNRISVKTLDLNQPFANIKKQLDKIAESMIN